MPRNMSFSMTTAQFRARTKTVTRRLGWWNLKPGDVIMGVEKAMGLKKGEKVKRLGRIRIVRCSRLFLSKKGPKFSGVHGSPLALFRSVQILELNPIDRHLRDDLVMRAEHRDKRCWRHVCETLSDDFLIRDRGQYFRSDPRRNSKG